VTIAQDAAVVIRTPGGRRLSYREFGPAAGAPLLYFPGTPSSGVEWLMWPPGSAEVHGCRVIAVDRPGLGGSDRQPGRRILDWPADVTALADALGLDRFRVLGYSGGVPYALACAELLPDRVTTAVVVACVGPDEIPGLTAELDPTVAKIRRNSRRRSRRWLARATWASVRMAASRYPQRVLAQTAAALPEPDRRALADPRVASAYLAAICGALRSGAAGATQDMALMASPWRLSPERIRIPVMLWQGELDRNAPPVMSRHLARVIPDCAARWFPHDGHLSVVTEHGGEIIAAISAPEGGPC
jgi:pimeloyl-ACP methyl ester carboxylesterase